MPNVSVVIPIYNGARYLEQTVGSVLSQTYGDFEIILVDDGSTDNTKKIAEKCIAKSPKRMRYFYQRNKGPGAARNNGIRTATGKYIAFLDADDEWLPEFLEKTIEKLSVKKCQWVYTDAYRVELDNNDNVIKKEPFKAPVSLGEDEDLYSAILREDVIGGPSKVVVAKECFEKTGGFREDLRIREDWEMWIRLAKHGFKVCKVELPLYIYKVRKNSTTKSNPLAKLAYEYRIVDDYSAEAFALNPAYREIYAEKMWSIARQTLWMEKKDYLLFLKCLIKSQLFKPSISRISKSLKTQLAKKREASA